MSDIEIKEQELDNASGGYGYTNGYTNSYNTTYYQVGQIIEYFGNCPAGFLPCDGRTLSATEYSPLYNAIGTSYGSNGYGTFCLPSHPGKCICFSGGVARY